MQQGGTASASQRAAASDGQDVCQRMLVAISKSELQENVTFFGKPGKSETETPECSFPKVRYFNP